MSDEPESVEAVRREAAKQRKTLREQQGEYERMRAERRARRRAFERMVL